MNIGELRTDPPSNLRVRGNTDNAGIVNPMDLLQLFSAADNIASTPASRSDYLNAVLPGLVSLMKASGGGLVSQRSGEWVREAWTGQESRLPIDQIADAIDGSNVVETNGGYIIAPIHCAGNPANELSEQSIHADQAAKSVAAIVVKLDGTDSMEEQDGLRDTLTKACHFTSRGLHRIELLTRQDQRIDQLSTVLQASAEWGRLGNDEELLKAIADTACELLSCERASIFLWDRRRSKLVGRPALGIQGGALEVDDDAGIVGEVLSTAEPRLWSASSDDESRVNRAVDHAQDFKTKSLVAVPMFGQREQLIGVFEAINREEGDFDSSAAELLSDLAMHASVAIESLRTQTSLTRSRDRLVDDAANAVKLIGEHESIQAVRTNADRVAGTDLTVLVLGKNGTGKEVLARHIHYASERRSGPFIAVNCAALVESLLESELFGHEQGAFTDAQSTRIGKFELANGGTLFLDEVGDMSPGGQAKLLRVLEEKVVVRVGGSQTIPVDVRVIAATNQPLETLIQEKRFREDLFFRLNVVSLTLPPLSMRGRDILQLAEHFLTQFRYEIGRPELRLGSDAQQALMSHAWPGNVRELRNTIERVSYLTSGDEIRAEDLMLGPALATGQVASTISGDFASNHGNATSMNVEGITLSDASRDFQIQHIRSTIELMHGNMTATAERLGLHRSNLYRKMRQLGMPTSGE